jgi:hypothetical protein
MPSLGLGDSVTSFGAEMRLDASLGSNIGVSHCGGMKTQPDSAHELACFAHPWPMYLSPAQIWIHGANGYGI